MQRTGRYEAVERIPLGIGLSLVCVEASVKYLQWDLHLVMQETPYEVGEVVLR